MTLLTHLRAAGGLQFAFLSGIGSERSHHGFRDHSHSQQHPIGGVYLFCRDSDLAGLEKLLDAHLSYVRSEIRAGLLVCDVRSVICDTRCISI